jgi:uncharacterized iron-regulated membrane protein
MTAGMVGFGGLLWTRRRLHRSEGALQRVPQHLARRAGRALLTITGIVAALVGVILTSRWHTGGAISALSVALPVTGLAWVALLGFQALNYREPATEAATAGERPSRRPPNWDPVSKPQSTSARPGPPDRHANA